jgi:predicted choloylglycine hydrolase
MTYNVTVLDAAGEFATVYVSPDRPAVVTRRGVATNHQGAVEWRQFAHATASIDRERFLIARRADAQETRSKFSDRFLQPPIYSTAFRQGWGTLYTVRYEPKGRLAEFRWATHALRQGFDDFSECAFSITYGSDTTPKG